MPEGFFFLLFNKYYIDIFKIVQTFETEENLHLYSAFPIIYFTDNLTDFTITTTVTVILIHMINLVVELLIDFLFI